MERNEGGRGGGGGGDIITKDACHLPAFMASRGHSNTRNKNIVSFVPFCKIMSSPDFRVVYSKQ